MCLFSSNKPVNTQICLIFPSVLKFPQQETKRHHFYLQQPDPLIFQREFTELLELEILPPPMSCRRYCWRGKIISDLLSTTGCWPQANPQTIGWGVNVHPQQGRTRHVCFMTQEKGPQRGVWPQHIDPSKKKGYWVVKARCYAWIVEWCCCKTEIMLPCLITVIHKISLLI